MPIILPPLVELLPWVYAFALIPASLLHTREHFWWSARGAGYLGLSLVLLAWLQAALNEQNDDRLGLAMAGLISVLALVIIDYSRRYLEGELGQQRYVLALLGTLAAVATVVTSTDLIVLVGAWIFSSLCLHQLLTFYRDRPQALVVAHKKFLASRLADVCLLLATGLLVHAGGDSSIAVILDAVNSRLQTSGQLGWDLQMAALLLALAVILKSAQLPVHGWLIQVVEAPTPVSALLHAGIINLGGILLLLFAPLLAYSTIASTLLLVAALVSTVLAALIMGTRISIKVRLAWSTVAQMGLMLVEIALGLYTLALLHLLAHSCYKAYAFLHSGNAVNHYLAAQLAGQTQPRAWHWLLSLLLAAGLLGLTQQLLAFSSLSSAVLLLLAITVLLAPAVMTADKRRIPRLLLALGYVALLLGHWGPGGFGSLAEDCMSTNGLPDSLAGWFGAFAAAPCAP